MKNIFNYKKTKWKRRDLIFLLERLELYLSAGLELNKALLICEQGLKPYRQKIMNKIRLAVESGGLLSKNLRLHIGLSETLSGLVGQGELSGSLSKSLHSARTLLEKEDELFKKCASAMAYPIVIGLFACLLTLGLVRGILPQIVPMLKSLQVELPLITRIVITVSDVLTRQGLYILIGLVFAIIIARISYTKVKVIRQVTQLGIVNLPLAGTLVHNYYLAVFLHSCGSLVESGVAVKEAYLGTVRSIKLIPLREKLERKLPDVSAGRSLSGIISGGKIPSYIPPLLGAGELSGTLGLSIIRAGTILDCDIEHSLKKITSLIEPIMMVAMGCVVGGIALSIMMPIYDISKVLQK